MIKELCDVMQDKMLIGAGTVLGADMANKSIDAGARFIISPVIVIAVSIRINRTF